MFLPNYKLFSAFKSTNLLQNEGGDKSQLSLSSVELSFPLNIIKHETKIVYITAINIFGVATQHFYLFPKDMETKHSVKAEHMLHEYLIR